MLDTDIRFHVIGMVYNAQSRHIEPQKNACSTADPRMPVLKCN